jgi:alpha,alpha-trehalose phosphorylase
MVAVYGFGGMRDYDGSLSFNPRLPEKLRSLRFALQVQGRNLEVEITAVKATYLLKKGIEFAITHQGEPIVLLPGIPAVMAIR